METTHSIEDIETVLTNNGKKKKKFTTVSTIDNIVSQVQNSLANNIQKERIE